MVAILKPIFNPNPNSDPDLTPNIYRNPNRYPNSTLKTRILTLIPTVTLDESLGINTLGSPISSRVISVERIRYGLEVGLAVRVRDTVKDNLLRFSRASSSIDSPIAKRLGLRIELGPRFRIRVRVRFRDRLSVKGFNLRKKVGFGV